MSRVDRYPDAFLTAARRRRWRVALAAAMSVLVTGLAVAAPVPASAAAPKGKAVARILNNDGCSLVPVAHRAEMGCNHKVPLSGGGAHPNTAAVVQDQTMRQKCAEIYDDDWWYTRFDACKGFAFFVDLFNSNTGAPTGQAAYHIEYVIATESTSADYSVEVDITPTGYWGTGVDSTYSIHGWEAGSGELTSVDSSGPFPRAVAMSGTWNYQALLYSPKTVVRAGFEMELWGAAPGYTTGSVRHIYSDVMRCDNMVYTGCVFPQGDSVVDYTLYPYPNIIQHIAASQAAGSPGGLVPGHPLHRTTDALRRDRNNAAICPRILTRPTGMDCDEYPFASTWEGGAAGPVGCPGALAAPTATRAWVPSGENRAAGGVLGAVFSRDHVLDCDAFYVNVTITGGGYGAPRHGGSGGGGGGGSGGSSETDLNGDGVADLLSQYNGGDLYAYPGSGGIKDTVTSSTFGTDTDIGAWVGHRDFALGDLNGDGRPDLLTQYNGHLWVYPGSGSVNGSTTFWSGTDIGAWIGHAHFALGDLTGDGRADLLTQYNGDHLYVYPGSGSINATTTFWSGTDIGAWTGHSNLALGDLNGDGHPDLLTQFNGNMYAYPGSGHVNATTTFWSGTMIGPWVGHPQFELGDMNNDGRADLLSRTDGGTYYAYPGSGSINATTTFWSGTELDTTDSFDYTLGDLNGDHRPDLLYQTGDEHLHVMLGSGAITATQTSNTTLLAGTDVGSWAGHSDMARGDLNGDGIDDLLTQTANGELYVYPGSGHINSTGTFLAGTDIGPWVGHTNLTLGDLNHDGHPDLLSQYQGNLYVYPGSGHIGSTGTFLAGTMIGPWIGHDHLVLGDLNGDGNADLLTQYNGDHLYVYPGSGHIGSSGTLLAGTDIGSWAGHVDFALGDLNRDGIADLVSMTSGGDLYVYAGEGRIATNGTFWSGRRLGPWLGHTNITL